MAEFEDAGISGKSLDRPGLTGALAAVEAHPRAILVVAKLDRLSRSLMDFANLMERSRRKNWSIVALDVGVDTSSPQGEMMASVMASFAQYERRLIGLRTKEALAVKRSQGVTLGRPREVSAEAVGRIVELRNSGLTFERVARQLDAEGISPPRGGPRWLANSARRIHARSTAAFPSEALKF